jgi:hypothetical protein
VVVEVCEEVLVGEVVVVGFVVEVGDEVLLGVVVMDPGLRLKIGSAVPRFWYGQP